MFFTNHPNEFAQIEILEATYRDIVPDKLLDDLIDAIRTARKPVRVHRESMTTHHWYIGRDPHSDSLILAQRGTVERFAEHAAAKAWASTWDQFRALTGTRSAADEVEYPSFLHYLKEALNEFPRGSLDEYWADYVDLSFDHERPTLGSDAFDQADFEIALYDRNAAVPDLRQNALWELPKPILREFGVIQDGGMMGGGDFVWLDPDRRDELEAAMRDLGFVLWEDSLLIDAAQNTPADPLEVYRRLHQNVEIEEMLDDLETRGDPGDDPGGDPAQGGGAAG